VAVETAVVTAPAAPRRPTRPGTPHGWVWASGFLTLAGSAVAIAVAPPTGVAPTRGLTWLLFVGSSVHVASTGWLFSFRDVRAHAARHPTRYLAAPLVLVTAAATMAVLLSSRQLALVLLGYFAWQFFHFSKQNLGIAALAASSMRVHSLTQAERRSILGTGWTGIAALMLHPGTLQLRLTPPVGWYPTMPFQIVAAGFGCCAAAGAFALFRRPAADRPLGYCFTYSVAVCFPLPIFLFSSPYAAVGGMTIAHGLQYLVVVGMVTAGPRDRRASPLRLVTLLALALLGGAGLSAASHLHTGGAVAHVVYGGYLGLVMAHFVVDAGIWRLRDPFPRAFLSSRLPSLLPPSPLSASDASSAVVR
jgi:hypothetical protein